MIASSWTLFVSREVRRAREEDVCEDLHLNPNFMDMG